MFPPGSGVRFTIGRNRDCDLCLTDLSVSRRHAQLVRREDGWIVSDLGSHNGTRLNGWLVREPVRLSAGDRIDFGSVAFVIAGDPPLMAHRKRPGRRAAADGVFRAKAAETSRRAEPGRGPNRLESGP